MKKLMIFLMAALVLMGTLLVSCNQNVGEDKLSSVTISEDMARSLSTSITTNVKPVDELTWYYQATKIDNGFFATGQTSGWTKVPGEGTGLVNKSLGKMSYGDWKFEFQGRDYTGETVYKVVFFCDGLYETINSDETMLTVPLAQGEGFDEAGIIFENLIFTLDGVDVNNSVKSGSTISSVQLVVTETGTQQSWIFCGEEYHAATEATDTEPAKPAYISFTPASTTRVKYTTSSSHPYRFAVKYNDNDIIEPFDFPVYIQLGYDMTISGDINAFEQQSEVTIEKTSETWTVQTAYTADKPAAQVSDMTATTDATPAKLADATSEGQTTVKAPSAALIAANGSIDEGSTVANSVKVTVSSTETASVTFAATDGNAFAGIDLKLIRKVTASGSDPVIDVLESANFGDNNPVIVETYIAKGLTNVALTYPADSGAAQPKASTDSTEIENHKAHVMTASEAKDGTTLGYYPVTGLLRFTTTHFSEFAVFADQYIFDKTTNMAYKLDENGLLDGAAFDNSHEYILLDPTKANLVSDGIDVFYASKSNWTVLHDSSDVENTTDFAGGYGTKIEPYKVSSTAQFMKITYVYKTAGEKVYYSIVNDLNFGQQDPYVDGYNDRYYCYMDDYTQKIHVNLNRYVLSGVDYPLFDNVCYLELFNGSLVYSGAYGMIADNVSSSTDTYVFIHDLSLEGTVDTSYSHYGPVVSYAYLKNNYDCEVKLKNIANSLTILNSRTSSYTGGFIGYIQGSKAKLSVESCTFAGKIQGMHVGGFVGGCSAPNGDVIINSGNKVSGILLGSTSAKAFGVSGNYNRSTPASVEAAVDTTGSTIMTISSDANLLDITVPYGSEFSINHTNSNVTYYTATLSFNVDVADGSSGGYPRNIEKKINVDSNTEYATGIYKCYVISSAEDLSTDETRVIDQSGVVVWKDNNTYYVYSQDYKLSDNGKAYVYVYGYNSNDELITYLNSSYSSKPN